MNTHELILSQVLTHLSDSPEFTRLAMQVSYQLPEMSFWFTQRHRFQTEIAESPNRVIPSTEPDETEIPLEDLLNHFQVWEKQRLSLPQIMAKARWFVLWHQPSGDSTPYGFAVLAECPNAIYGYSLWARQSGRVQRIATATDKTMLDHFLQAERCELTTEAVRVRLFLQNVTHQLTTSS
ncbi:hypothetical protein [Larkinella humicola]|uniref:Uncharacterized protein n=1 Tax=Larkinella humicola TaxID=2607654 RepID=A0A5N1JG51_9BACT|nr:hypothetical protein [Larkinella humicola]KAA9353467.1 hypothetical protein F0P93_12530 [Larkinella humicola]